MDLGGTPTSIKYVVKVKMEVSGIVEKHDIIGAMFGQTEGLLGGELDLRELQKMGRLGRIEVKTREVNGKTVAEIEIPSNLDKVETALIAAAIESVDRVGPYNAKTQVVEIKDVRAEKRKQIVERAISLLKKLEQEMPESKELLEEVLERVRAAQLIEYGPEKLPAGPDVDKSDTIIVVEGRADVINLLKHGYRNVIAVGGASIPKTIVELSKRKTAILFVDGDRGGELIARNLINVAEIDYVARAPPGREVEELTGKEIAKALQNKMTVEELLESIEKERKPHREIRAEVIVPAEKILEKRNTKAEASEQIEVPRKIVEKIEELKGTLEAVIYDDQWNELVSVPVKDLASKLKEMEKIGYIVFDGIVTQRLVDLAYTKGAKAIIGARIGDIVRKPTELVISSFRDVRESSS